MGFAVSPSFYLRYFSCINGKLILGQPFGRLQQNSFLLAVVYAL
jgi:hypothetical protein